MFACCEIWLFQ